jgi:small nuclear ribonucleoprotein (snRNP)-like protein
MIVLRDGRHLVGVLRSFDQFSNMVMEDTSERRVLNVKVSPVEDGAGMGSTICYYTDIQLGLYLVRGDSMVLLGEVEVEQDGNDDGDKSSGETKEAGDVADGNMIGSGLLGGPQKNVIEEKKKYMKEVTLEEFERLVEEHQKGDGDADGAGSSGGDGAGAVEQLTWEFDTDLYV